MSQTHRKGFVITLSGVLVLTPDTLLVRLADADLWTLMFWRGLLMGLGLLVLYAAAEGPGWLARLRALGLAGLAAGLLFSFNNIAFVLALEYTTVANTLVIIATVPLFAAILSRVFLKEPVALRTWLAIVAACSGIGLIFSGSLGGGGLLGDLAAVGVALGLAGGFVIVRHNRRVNMVPTMALGALISATVAAPLAAPLSVEPGNFGWLLLMGLGVLPVSFGLITLGPRYLPAPEVSLLMLLETVLGPLLVWAGVGETASPLAIAGGGVVVATLGLHALASLRRRPAPPASQAPAAPRVAEA